jgi:hypothetical protein
MTQYFFRTRKRAHPDEPIINPAASPNEPKPKRPAILEQEKDPHRLAMRQKQIDFGKNTAGYDNYISQKTRYTH